MEFSLEQIWASMGTLAKVVVAVLGVMAVAAVTVTVDRLVLLYLARKRARRFGGELGERLDDGSPDDVRALAARQKRNPLAQLVQEGVEAYAKGTLRPGHRVSAGELARRAMTRRADTISADLRRGMSVLASVGSTAPFVGLFGTVVGIINAFHGIAATGSGGLAAVSAGIAEALVVTALGLGVAIPAVLLFNSLSTRIDRFELALSSAGGEFADWLDGLDRRPAADESAELTDRPDLDHARDDVLLPNAVALSSVAKPAVEDYA
ncbi:MAG: MotA/TolQ/ExbB proton channel family protein [Deltaproteobacteria bacterium]|nr:MotA/TolQ/ExbB proton channel family protein [Deltaproteobacteria bacterium]